MCVVLLMVVGALVVLLIASILAVRAEIVTMLDAVFPPSR